MTPSEIYKQKLSNLRGDRKNVPETPIEILAASCIVNEMMIQDLYNKIAQLEGKVCKEGLHIEKCVYLSATEGKIWCHSKLERL